MSSTDPQTLHPQGDQVVISTAMTTSSMNKGPDKDGADFEHEIDFIVDTSPMDNHNYNFIDSSIDDESLGYQLGDDERRMMLTSSSSVATIQHGHHHSYSPNNPRGSRGGGGGATDESCNNNDRNLPRENKRSTRYDSAHELQHDYHHHPNALSGQSGRISQQRLSTTNSNNNNNTPSPEGTICCSSSTENSSEKHLPITTSRTSVQQQQQQHHHHLPPPQPPMNIETCGHRFSRQWTNWIVTYIHRPLLYGMHALAVASARNPFRTTGFILFVTFATLVIGFATNFYIEVDEQVLWTPVQSDADIHHHWLTHESHFPSEPRKLVVFFHGEGENILTRSRIRQIFNATDTIMNMNSYNDVCLDGQIRVRLPNGTKVTTCYISGIIRFWNYSSLIYEWTIQTEEQAILALSEEFYPDGGKVVEGDVFGKPRRDPQTGLLINMTSFPLVFALPDTKKAEELELKYVHALLELNELWQQDPDLKGLYVGAVAPSSFAEEFTRGIVKDIPLIPFVFVLMSAFSCLYMYRRNSVQSRCILGLAAVFCVLQSVMGGYGLMFIFGIPFTSMTQLVPFIIFGIGLDDAFIIIDTYERTDAGKEPDERISDTIKECGVSLFLTTLTSVSAFALGCTSSIPAISWLCWYAFPTIAMVLLYQITLFVAFIVIDEMRIQQRRRDIFFCYRVRDFQEYAKGVYEYNKAVAQHEDLSYKCMYWFSKKLFLPSVKVIVLVSFVTFTGFAAWSTSQFEQRFHFREVLPKGSYVVEVSDASEKYRDSTIVRPEILFRNEDFSDSYVQDQMEQFVDAFSNMESTQRQPDTFWLRDFRDFVTINAISHLSFNEQMDAFMSERVYYDLHRRNMAFSSNGTLIESRCYTKMEYVQMAEVKAQIDALAEQDAVARAMPINEGKENLSFFSYAREYSQWAFYTACIPQLIQNTYLGIICVTIVALIIIPHWSAALIVCPIVIMMYVDILGVLQWAGIPINAVTFVSLVMSIGLIVDYIMHILIKYYETGGRTREDRLTEVLCTMGASVLAGGLSTFLGTLPLAFSSSQIFWIVFMTFVSLVTIALAHALIFLPVLLSIIGTEDVVPNQHKIEHAIDDVIPMDVLCSTAARDDTARTERRLSM